VGDVLQGLPFAELTSLDNAISLADIAMTTLRYAIHDALGGGRSSFVNNVWYNDEHNVSSIYILADFRSQPSSVFRPTTLFLLGIVCSRLPHALVVRHAALALDERGFRAAPTLSPSVGPALGAAHQARRSPILHGPVRRPLRAGVARTSSKIRITAHARLIQQRPLSAVSLRPSLASSTPLVRYALWTSLRAPIVRVTRVTVFALLLEEWRSFAVSH
jgi:hypothetical protein